VALWRLDEDGDDGRRLVRFEGHGGAVVRVRGRGRGRGRVRVRV